MKESDVTQLMDIICDVQEKLCQSEKRMERLEKTIVENGKDFERKLERQSILNRSINTLLGEQDKTGGVSGRKHRHFLFGAPDLVPVSISDQELQELPPPKIV